MEEVAGYRVLRVAARGARTRLLLGFGGGRTVVLKVADAGDPAVEAELEALDRGAGDHVVDLLDVAADEHTTTLVLERLPRGTLADLLERRGALGAGEVVTILAPVATTLDRLHAAGVAHGALSLATIGFRADGAPTLLGLGSAELFAPGAPEIVREEVAGVRADRAALRELATLVLARVAGPRTEAARRVAQGLAELAPAQLATALFGIAAPEAVRFDDETHATEPRLPVAAGGGAGVEAATPALPPAVLALVPDGLRTPVESVASRVADVWAGWTAARRRLVLGGAAAVITVVVAVAALPAPSRSTAAPRPAASPAVDLDSAPGDDLPDDPVDAAGELLERRERCLGELSVLCLEGVVQSGSAAQERDVALVRAILAGEETPPGIRPGPPVLVERLGDSALLDLPPGSTPGSILVLRTTNGWRIRSYLDAPAVDEADDAASG